MLGVPIHAPASKEPRKVETISDNQLSSGLEEDNSFKEFFIKKGVATKIFDVGLEVKACVDFNVKMRLTPLEDVEEISKKLNCDENLQIAGIVIDIADVKGFFNRCEQVKIRHNIHPIHWETCQTLSLRLYESVSSSDYVEVNTELTADYIIVCPQEEGGQQGGGWPNNGYDGWFQPCVRGLCPHL